MASFEKGQIGASDHAEYVPDTLLIEAAIANSDKETQLPRKELFSRYWPGAVYSVLLSMALIMEGMDVGLVSLFNPSLEVGHTRTVQPANSRALPKVNNFFGHQGYLNKFGWPDANGKQHIPTSWQSAIGAYKHIRRLACRPRELSTCWWKLTLERQGMGTTSVPSSASC